MTAHPPLHAGIAALAAYLPARVLDNGAIEALHPRFNGAKVAAKTGIERRHIAGPDECASDLAAAAGARLMAEKRIDPASIDHLILCTQAPDHFLPSTACLVHRRLGLPAAAGAVDIAHGCSGFVYGLGLAAGLIASGQARRILLLTADTYSKFIDRNDIATLSIFGDAGAAALVEAGRGGLGPFVYGTDGAGAPHLIVPTGGLRQPAAAERYVDAGGVERPGRPLHMNGPEVFNFTIGAVPLAVAALLEKAGVAAEAVDLYVFHQANATMLEALRRKLAIPPERFFVDLAETGNTVSSTIPLALLSAAAQGRLKSGMRVMLVGFGVGYSWAATLLTWG